MIAIVPRHAPRRAAARSSAAEVITGIGSRLSAAGLAFEDM